MTNPADTFDTASASSIPTLAPASPRLSRIAIGLGLIAACATWALWPVSGIEKSLAQAIPNSPAAFESEKVDANKSPQQSTAFTDLDTDAFRTPLWVIPPPPPPPPAPPEPPKPLPPLKLQLISITQETANADASGKPLSRFAAVFYDPDKDMLITVREGMQLADRRQVGAITASSVEIREADGRKGAGSPDNQSPRAGATRIMRLHELPSGDVASPRTGGQSK